MARGRVGLAAALGALLLACALPAASGAAGLSFSQCFERTGGGTVCDDTPALGFPRTVGMTPDGRYALAAAGNDQAIVVFSRDPATGKLAPAGCAYGDAANPVPSLGCSHVDVLDRSQRMLIAPDGSPIISTRVGTSTNSGTVLVQLALDPDSGALTFESCSAGVVPPERPQPDPRCKTVIPFPNLGQPVYVAPDGARLITLDDFYDRLFVFDRDPATGELDLAQCLDPDPQPGSPCEDVTQHLTGPLSAAVSPDGDSVFVVNALDDSLVQLVRGTTGDLKFQACIRDTGSAPTNCASAPGLSGVTDVVVSADGRSVYTTASGSTSSETGDALVALDEDRRLQMHRRQQLRRVHAMALQMLDEPLQIGH